MDTNFGRYRAEEKIGQGGFGVVYRALDTNVQRPVALKILTVKTTEDDFARFEAEARTTSGLQHKNIVTVHDYGMQNGMPFIVMELLNGRTLLEEIHLGKVALLEKIAIMQQVAEGLQYAHGRRPQVIHRDIKPANIMVQQDGVVKIMDFGIARVIQEDVTRRTQAGVFMGTPAYTAPERFKGESDAQTDIFAFGVVFYELVTGSNPFAGGDYAEIAYRVRYVDPPPVGEVVAGIPHALDHLISRSIDKDREVRYASLDAVLRDLRPIFQKLQQQRAEEMFNQLRPFLSRHEGASPASLLERLGEVLIVFEHPEAREWHDRLEEDERRKRRAFKIAALRQEGEEHLGARRLREAVRSFEDAARLDKDDVELKWLLASANDALDRQTKAGRLYAEAVDLEQQGRYGEALEKVRAALENDPENRLAKRSHDLLLQRQRQQQMHGILDHAESLRRQKKFDQALQTLAELDSDDASAASTIELRNAIEHDRADEELREQEESLILQVQDAQNDLNQGRLADAGEKADRLSREFGNQSVVLQLKEDIALRRRAATVAQALARAKDLCSQQMFAVAAVELQEALRKCRGDKQLEAALEFVLKQEKAQTRAADVVQILNDCRALAASGKEAESLEKAKRGISDLGREPELLNFVQQLSAEIEKRNKQQRQEQEGRKLADSALQKALELERRHAYRQALQALQTALAAVHDDRLDEACERIQDKLKRQDEDERTRLQEDDQRRVEQQQAQNQRKVRETAIAKAMADANALVRKRRFQAACDVLERSATVYPDAPELRQAYEKVKRDWEDFERAERERIAKEKDENQRRARETAVATGIASATALLQQQEFERAFDVLERLGGGYPEAGEIKVAYQKAQQAREAFERAAQHRAGREKAGSPLNKKWLYVSGAIILLVGGVFEMIKLTTAGSTSHEQRAIADHAERSSNTPRTEPRPAPDPPAEPANPEPVAVSVSESELSFEFDGERQPPQMLKVSGGKDFTASADQHWLHVAKAGTDEIRVDLGNAVAEMKNGIYKGHVEIQTQGQPIEVPVRLQIEKLISTDVEWSGTLHPHEKLTISGGSSSIGRLKRGLPKGIVSASVSGVDDSNKQVKTSKSLSQDTLVIVNEDGSRNIENLTISIRSK